MIVKMEPAGTETTMFAVLDVSMLERMFKPQVTSALTRAEEVLVEAGTVVGGVGGVLIVEDEPGCVIPPLALKD